MKKNNVIPIKKSWLDRLKKFIKEQKKLADRYLKKIKEEV